MCGMARPSWLLGFCVAFHFLSGIPMAKHLLSPMTKPRLFLVACLMQPHSPTHYSPLSFISAGMAAFSSSSWQQQQHGRQFLVLVTDGTVAGIFHLHACN